MTEGSPIHGPVCLFDRMEPEFQVQVHTASRPSPHRRNALAAWTDNGKDSDHATCHEGSGVLFFDRHLRARPEAPDSGGLDVPGGWTPTLGQDITLSDVMTKRFVNHGSRLHASLSSNVLCNGVSPGADV